MKENKEENLHNVNLELNGSKSELSKELLDDEAVILATGKNLFGDPVYSYIKFSLQNFLRMREAMSKGENFKPTDYGEVIASGKGEPSKELKQEMKERYGLADTPDSQADSNPVPGGEDKEEQSIQNDQIEPLPELGPELSNEILRIGKAIKGGKNIS